MQLIWRNTDDHYGLVAKTLHWLMAVLIITMLCLGLYMTRLPISPDKFKLYALHKSVGVCVLALAVLRLFWRQTNLNPRPFPNHQSWERHLARIVHILLYVLMFAMPLSGWIMSSAKNFSISVFDIFTLPNFVAPNDLLADNTVLFHRFAAYALIGIVGLHIAGALKHHVIDRDNTLKRMLPFCRPPVIILALLLLPLNAQAAPIWTIDHTQSSLEFDGTQMNAPFTGHFSNFDGQIAFDPNDLANSHAVIAIVMSSVTTNSKDRDQYIGMPAWLDSKQFPQAIFESSSFEKNGDAYIAHGKLTLHGITLPVNLPFTLAITGGVAKMQGEVTLSRLDYGIGTGEWADPKTVGTGVKVRVKLLAKQT